MKNFLFIVSIAWMVFITLIEARQDYLICQFDNPAGGENWKLWGNAFVFGWIFFYGTVIAFLQKRWVFLLWIPILCLVWWIVHDCAIGYFLTGSIWHIGTTGFDEFMGKIFQSGVLYFIWKVVILIILTGSYFSIK